jgi:hypothetical protein
MTVVADESRVLVSAPDVVWHDIISEVAAGYDSPREIGQRNIRIASQPSAVDQAKIPVVASGYVPIFEGQRRCDGQEISDTRSIVDGKGGMLAGVSYLQSPAAAYIGASPGLAGKQCPDSAISVHPQYGHMSGPIGSKVYPHSFTLPVWRLAVKPDAHASGDGAPFGFVGLSHNRSGGGVQRSENEKPPQGDEHESSRRIEPLVSTRHATMTGVPNS